MLFIARFEDDPEAVHVREAQTDNHLAFLAEHEDHILVAGALREEPDHTPIGALWIIEADSREDAEALIEQDPFWISGLRRSRSLLHWSRALPDHPVSI